MFLDLSGRALTTASPIPLENCSRTYLAFARQLAVFRDRENVLWHICALVSAIDVSSAQGCSWICRELPDAREKGETVGTVPGPVRLKPARRCQSQNEVPTITNTALLKADCPGARNGLCYVAQDLLQFGF